ncbi:hypothetical protein K488DRAFT_56240 [Vararia minispora EC-137]|uniref:Uncharacterized protein n=1 Tax=Vararia minispora EC-137 TaxID=1314806 RepID=A0ACB8QCY5_9AGAM|nr:hypothetical protein K488DRAFT_56240 [Vararia minispora EC-137]
MARLHDYHILGTDELLAMIATTKGYYSRDYSLWLGWNNMRYIIDAAFLQAKLLNRTLILPSFVYARTCEYDTAVCSEHAEMVSMGTALGMPHWNKVDAWRIPLPLMLNITRMRAAHPVILVADYLRLHDLPADFEAGNGEWDRVRYPAETLFVVENEAYDPRGTVRVDSLPDEVKARGNWTLNAKGVGGAWMHAEESAVSRHLRHYVRPSTSTADYDIARNILKRTEFAEQYDLLSADGFAACLHENGWEILHTFDMHRKTDMARTVVNPIRQVAQRTSLRSWTDDYGDVDTEVLVLVGETHSERKAGTMLFTTDVARKAFQRAVLQETLPNDAFLALAETLAQRMSRLVQGRLWMGAHMRRGDFVSQGWAVDRSAEKHLWRVKAHLEKGRKDFDKIKDVQPYDVPDMVPNMDLVTLERPDIRDPFYLATDERDPVVLKMFRDTGGVVLQDLLTEADEKVIGWPLAFMAVRGVVEQSILAHSAFFTGSSLSSVAGGIVNMRAARGADWRTVFFS